MPSIKNAKRCSPWGKQLGRASKSATDSSHDTAMELLCMSSRKLKTHSLKNLWIFINSIVCNDLAWIEGQPHTWFHESLVSSGIILSTDRSVPCRISCPSQSCEGAMWRWLGRWSAELGMRSGSWEDAQQPVLVPLRSTGLSNHSNAHRAQDRCLPTLLRSERLGTRKKTNCPLGSLKGKGGSLGTSRGPL